MHARLLAVTMCDLLYANVESRPWIYAVGHSVKLSYAGIFTCEKAEVIMYISLYDYIRTSVKGIRRNLLLFCMLHLHFVQLPQVVRVRLVLHRTISYFKCITSSVRSAGSSIKRR